MDENDIAGKDKCSSWEWAQSVQEALRIQVQQNGEKVEAFLCSSS